MVKGKRVIAREFLILLSVSTIILVAWGYMGLCNMYHEKQIANFKKSVSNTHEQCPPSPVHQYKLWEDKELDELIKKAAIEVGAHKEAPAKKGLSDDELLELFGGTPKGPHKELIDYLHKNAYPDMDVKIIREKVLGDKGTFNKALEYMRSTEYNDIPQADFQTKYISKYGDPFASKAVKIQGDSINRQLVIHRNKIISDAEEMYTLRICAIILLTLAFPLRFVIYSTLWSIKVLKNNINT